MADLIAAFACAPDANERVSLALMTDLARRWCEGELARLAARGGIDGTRRASARMTGRGEAARPARPAGGLRHGPSIGPPAHVAGNCEGAMPAFGFRVARGDTADEAREPTAEVMASLMVDRNERAALALTNEIARRWCEGELARLAATVGDEVQVDGDRYRRHATGIGVYHGLWAALRVRRDSYRRVGVRNGPTIVPLELVEGATPAFAQGHAAMPRRHYEQELRAAHRVPPARATIERMAKRLGVAMRAAIPIVEPVARAAERIPEAAVAISIGLDRTSTPMEEARDAHLPPGPRQRRRAPYQRRAPDPVQVNYRMAYVGTFALHDAAGAVLVSRRFAATAAEGPDDVIVRVFAEVAHARATRPTLPLAIVQDGAPEPWNLMTAACARHGVTPAVEPIDRYHLDEHIAALLDLVAATDGCAETLRRRWAAALDRARARPAQPRAGVEHARASAPRVARPRRPIPRAVAAHREQPATDALRRRRAGGPRSAAA